MHGNLQGGSVADLLRDLAGTRSTAIVTLSGPRGQAAIHVHDGRIVAVTTPAPRARMDERLSHGLIGSDDLAQVAIAVFHQEELLDALLDISTWEQGSYEVSESGDVRPGPVALDVEDAVPEVGRRRRQLQEMSGTVPGPGLAPTRTDRPLPPGLEPDERAVLAAVDGTRDVRTLAGDLGFTVYETARVLHGLALLEVVELVDPRPSAADEPPNEVVDEASAGQPDEPASVTTAPSVTFAGAEVPHEHLVAEAPDEEEPVPWESRDLVEADEPADESVDRRPEPEQPPLSEIEDDLEALLAALEEGAPDDRAAEPPFDLGDPGSDVSEVSQLLRELSRLADDDAD